MAWSERSAAVRLEERKAAIANNFFLQRSHLRIWHERMRRRKVAAWLSDRDGALLREAFSSECDTFEGWEEGVSALTVHSNAGWKARAKQEKLHAVLSQGIRGAIDHVSISVESRTDWGTFFADAHTPDGSTMCSVF